MWRAISALVLVSVLALPPAAQATQAVPGGRYEDSIHGLGKIVITLANDAGEVADPSYVDVTRHCRGSVYGDFFSLDGDPPYWRATQVRADGSIAYHSSARRGKSPRYRLSAHVVAGGIRLAGVLRLRSGPTGCRALRRSFSARLTRQPNAAEPGVPVACDRVRRGRIAAVIRSIDVVAVNRGCTAAHQLARSWDASQQCPGLAPGGSCVVAGEICTAVLEGSIDPASVAVCVSSTGAEGSVELAPLAPCSHPDPGATVYAVNVGCAEARAFPMDDLLDNQACDDDPVHVGASCRIATYTCVVLRALGLDPYLGYVGFEVRCTSDRSRHQALDIEYWFGP